METIASLAAAAREFSIADHGDPVEKEAAALIEQHLPGYERVWQLFTFPFRDNGSVWIKSNLHPAHEAVVIYHYSILRSGLRAYDFCAQAEARKSEHDEVGSDLFYDFCLWLGVAYERVDQQAGALYRFLVTPAVSTRPVITSWDRHAEKFADWLGSIAYQNVSDAHDAVKAYRNRIVHGIKFPGGLDRIPKAEYLDELLYWSSWAELAKTGGDEWESKTVNRFDLIAAFWGQFCSEVSTYWKQVVERVMEEFGEARFVDHELANLPDRREPPARLIRRVDAPGHGDIPSGTAFPTDLSSNTTYPSE